MGKISRRDFLKFSSTLSLAFASMGVNSITTKQPLTSSPDRKPNIFIFVWDAMSSGNMSVYGYERTTTPFLERFAQKATVFHSHYAGGNFTTPGTATLLTGLYPWRHRAFTLEGLVNRDLAGSNVFQLLGDEYYRVGYAQNLLADLLLRQFESGLDRHVPVTSFLHEVDSSIIGQEFSNDPMIAYYAIDEFLASSRHFVNPHPGSLTLGFADMVRYSFRNDQRPPLEKYPRGMPFNGFFYYQIDTVFDGLFDVINDASLQDKPVFGYFHTFSPHNPYSPTMEFVHELRDIKIPFKRRHPLSYARIRQAKLNEYRTQYDQYVSNVDAEFGAFMDAMDAAGLLENSYVIVTADHGETFERGEYGHGSALLYDPVVRIPLLVSAPGQKTRNDVYLPTSNADILPTALHIAGVDKPYDMDGRILPGLGGTEDWERSIFMLEAKANSTFLPLSNATIAMVKGNRKLVYYLGYSKHPDAFEFYDLQVDPEEMNDLYVKDGGGAAKMKDELLSGLSYADRVYAKNRN